MLCLAPAFVYLGQDPRTRRPVPFFPVLNIVFGIYYLLPMVLGVVDNYYNAPVSPRSDYDYPVHLVFLGWSAMILGYLALGWVMPRGAKRREVPWNPRVLAGWGFGLMFGGLAITALRTLIFSAPMMGGLFQFILSLQWLGTGILVVLVRRGELSRLGKIWLAVGVVLSAATMLANGNIAPMALFFAVCAFAMWVGKPHFKARWIVGVVLAILFATSFRGIAIDFRRAAGDTNVQLSQSQSLTMMVSLLSTRIETQGLGGAIVHGLSMTAGRSAILDLFANVVRRTPSEVPHWNGETYASLAGSVIPRVLWPDKPTKELGQGFGHRYRLINPTNTTTAINLPILVEFFVNFGGAGVLAGMCLVGIIYRGLDQVVNRPGQSPIISMIAVVILLPMLMIESDFSLVLGGLPLTGAAFYAVWWQMRMTLGAAA